MSLPSPPPPVMLSAQPVRDAARALGFTMIGLTRATPSPTLDAYHRWLGAGYHADMGYMARPDRVARREDLSVIVPGVRSLVVVGVPYPAALPPALLNDPARGRIAAYAWGDDYHDVLLPRLEALAEALHTLAGTAAPQRAYVDTGPLLERSHAHQAGLGFVGKNTMLIHPRRGSLFVLGELLTTYAFDTYDQPQAATRCGTCTRCLAACPTDAFPQPFVLDARRCISYHTIENKGWVPRALRASFGNWVFGCDVCQDVCPWQRFAPLGPVPLFPPPDPDRAAPRLADLLLLDEAAFAARFQGTPLLRAGRARLLRNACIAAGNSPAPGVLPLLEHLLHHDASPLVRGHAGWALAQRLGGAARSMLAQALAAEPDPDARDDLAASLTAITPV